MISERRGIFCSELLYQGRDQCLDINDLPEPSYFPTTFCFIFANERINNYRQEVVIQFMYHCDMMLMGDVMLQFDEGLTYESKRLLTF